MRSICVFTFEIVIRLSAIYKNSYSRTISGKAKKIKAFNLFNTNMNGISLNNDLQFLVKVFDSDIFLPKTLITSGLVVIKIFFLVSHR